MAEEVKKHEFRAEVCKVLNILTNSLYTNRKVFLRELISNASDSLDKLRFRTNRGEHPTHDVPLEIRITIDKDAKTITIADTGIGMSEEELSENLGTIAKSGTEAFLQALSEAPEESEKSDASGIIGRFGVGFYSVFMVADNVRVISRPAYAEKGSPAHVWTSDGLGTFTIETITDENPVRGTSIVAHLKDNALEFLEKGVVLEAIKTHSGFIPFPIFVDGERVNTQPALWREPKTQVTEEQYNSFYTAFSFDSKPPFSVLHIAVDAPVQFSALLFIPDMKDDFYVIEHESWGLDLYSRRVLIQHNTQELLPDYFAFVKGVVDIEDLPLNISRETLQENVVLQKVRQVLEKQLMNKLESLAKDHPDQYEHFWSLHNRFFKLFYRHWDIPNKEKFIALMRVESSAVVDGKPVGLTNLDAYQERALSGQKTFWYVAAQSSEAAKFNPHMDMFKKKGIEVLYLLEPIDEIVFQGFDTYKEWNFRSVETATYDDLKDFPDVEETAKETPPLSNEDSDFLNRLLEHMKSVLGEKVKSVRLSNRLADSPAVLVSADGMTTSMEKIMKAVSNDRSMPIRDLEINKDHPLVRDMVRMFKAQPTDPVLQGMIENLYDTCLIMDGFILDPQQMGARIQQLLVQSASWYTEIRKL
ncbi:MAG: molecular chaperone HtpG [Desulfovibrio sp.]|nr:molecular chaperone HtpG [Desulfovibrio sp.]